MNRSILVVDVAQYQLGLFPKIMPDVYSIISKCGQGLWEDPTYRDHLSITQANGLVDQAYYWPDPIQPVNKQVEFVKSLWLKAPARFLWIDCEQWWMCWGSWYQAIRKEIEWSLVSILAPNRISSMYFETITKLTDAGIPCGIYTSTGFVGSYAPKMALWMNQFDIWLAQYGRQPKSVTTLDWETVIAKWLPNYKLRLPAGVDPEKIVGHQFTGDRMLLPGMYSDKLGRNRSAADVSVFNAEWLEKLGKMPTPVIPEVPKPLYVGITTAGDGLRIRRGPGIGFEKIGSLPYQSAVEILEERNGWGRIGEPVAGWISLAWVRKI